MKSKTDKDFELIAKTKTFKKYDYKKSNQYFFDFINDLSSNNLPTVINSAHSPICFVQSFYISLINYYKNINNPNSLNKTLMICDDRSFNLNGWINWSFLKQQNIWNGISDFEQLNSTNIKNFNVIKTVDIFSKSLFEKQINSLINVGSYNQNTKIDIIDLNLFVDRLIGDFIKNKQNSKLYYYLKKANRITFISEGASHGYKTIPYLENLFINHKPAPRNEVIKKLKDFQDDVINDITLDDVLDFMSLKNFETTKGDSKFDFIHFINYDANTRNTLNLSDDNHWSETSFSLNSLEYANLLNDESLKNKFLNSFNNVFTENDLIVSGIENYDPNKKNVIFLGSSLFIPFSGENLTPENFSRLQQMPNVLSQVQKTFNDLLQKFPSSQYNIMFKLHPRFSNVNDVNFEIAKNYIKLISNNQISNPIILNTNTPMEIVLMNQYYKFIKNQNNYLFKGNKPYEWTTFMGFQATTTSIHISKCFYQSVFDLSKEEVDQLIPFANFPIPTYFRVVKRVENDNLENWYEDNVNEIIKVYKYFCPSIFYNNKKLKYYDSFELNF